MATSTTRRRKAANRRPAGRIFYDGDGRPFRRTYLRRAPRAIGQARKLPRRDANGRFIKRRTPRRHVNARPMRRRLPRTSVVREASLRSAAGPALVRRRWWRVDGPVDPSLPQGYAYQR